MIPVLDPISNRISLYLPASTRTWLSMSLYFVVVPKRGLVPSIGREVMTVLLFPYGPMLCSRFTRLQLTVRYRKPSWMSTGLSLMCGVYVGPLEDRYPRIPVRFWSPAEFVPLAKSILILPSGYSSSVNPFS